MDCSFSQFWGFEKALTKAFGAETDDTGFVPDENDMPATPLITFFGSNDFHHLTLAFARRFRQPFNFV